MLSSRQSAKRNTNNDCYSDKLRQQFQDNNNQQKAASNLRRQKLKNFQYEDDDLDFINEDHQWRQAAQILSHTEDDLVDDLRQQQQQQQQQRQRQQDENQDDNSSSISFAQSGCHSILSAWRFKANRLKKKKQQQLISSSKRPQSVLSNASTNFTRKSTTSSFKNNNRILLGYPSQQKQQSYFVTNSQRRRRANELILSTLDARRRAYNLQRNASLFGSNLYLNDDLENLMDSGKQQYTSRHSLSPSPVALSNSQLANEARRSKSPSAVLQRPALSDLGLSSAAATNRGSYKPKPLAKKVSSSSRSNSPETESSEAESEHSSSGSQFTQLVTSELTPNCLDLLNNQFGNSRISKPTAASKTLISAAERLPISEPIRQRQKADEAERSERGSDLNSNSNRQFRRDVLMRDSIRRLRLSNRAQQPAQQPQQRQIVNDADESSSSTSSDQQLKQLKPLPKARKMDIENNPFLKRGHFRTTSVRSVESTISKSNAPENQQPIVRANKPKILTPKPRITPSETINTFNSSQANSNKKDDEDDVQLVERMLRQMKPNQVFTSYNKQKSETLLNSNERILTTLNEPIKLSKVPSQHQQAAPSSSRSMKTSDSVVSRSSPTRAQRMELPDRIANISPPLGFGDSIAEEPNYYLNREPKTRLVIVEPRSRSTTSIKKIEISKQQQQPQIVNRSVSVERPPIVATRRKITPQTALRTTSQQDLKPLPVFERTADDEFKKRVDYLRKLAKANLDSDESAKNNSNKQQQRQQPLTRPMSTNWSRNEPTVVPTTDRPKPLLSSPSGRTEVTQSLFDERARWKSGPYANKEDLSPRRSPATTNLDSILADRYQLNKEQSLVLERPDGGNRWRRSNSSLASLNSPTKTETTRKAAAETAVDRRPIPRPTSPLVLSTSSRPNTTNILPPQRQPKQTDLNDTQMTSSALVK